MGPLTLTSAPTDRPEATASETAPTPPGSPAPRLVWHLRLVAVVIGLAAICFRQSPGLIVPDTKLDLTADPAGFLLRALHLWDPQGALGQLQNQAYGYLFPVGPFHLLLTGAGLPAWVVQRLWWTTILVVAFLGIWRLSRAMGVEQPWVRLVIAVVYALGPRMLSEVAITSVEVWPLALAPWVLLPLVVPDRSVRWRATRSGLAFACVGGVNAVASGAVLVLPLLWLLTRRWDRELLRLALAWAPAVVVASAWWVLPLLVLGRNSPPFLSWIENAAVTTATASPFEALRGTSAWLGFLATPAGPSWPAAWLLLTSPLLVVATTVVAACGLAGLALRRTPHRAFLMLGLVVGLGLVTLGNPVSGWFPEAARHLLDGPLAPLRNTHKFELVVRLPLVIGLGHLLARAHALLRSGRVSLPAWSDGWVRRGLPALVVTSLLVVACAPAVGVALARPEGYRVIPDHWRQAAAWLDAQAAPGAVLVAPAASFSDLTWGSTKDEPLQALMHRPFVVRDAVPLGSAGATRLLDSLQDRLGSGQRVDGLRTVLAGAGIGFVLVRNEIRLDAQGSPPAAVTRALVESGLRRVASFGPLTGAYGESDSLTVDHRTLVQRPAIEIYAVSGAQPARLVSTADLARVTGGPESLLGLADATGRRDVLAGTDALAVPTSSTSPWVLTDGQRRREVDFGSAADNTSQLLSPDDPGRSGRTVIDYTSDPGAGQTVLHWRGVRSVTASSSASDATATLRLGPGNGPAAALDADLRTRWVSGTYGSAVGEWFRVDLDGERDVSGTTISVSGNTPVAAEPAVLRVETAAGATTSEVRPGPILPLLTPPGRTSWIRITLARVGEGAPNGFSINEIGIPGVDPGPTAVLPASASGASGTPDAVLLQEGARGRSACLTLDAVARCSPTLGQEWEETGWSRQWSAERPTTYAVSGTVRALDGPAAERLLALPSGIEAAASSRLVDAPSGRPEAALDGDPGTGWVAGEIDPAPWFSLRLPQPRVLSGLTFTKSFDLAASTPVEVRITFDDGSTVTRRADSEGRVSFPSKRTRTLKLAFGDVRLLENIDSATGRRTFAPTGFSELRLSGAADLVRPLSPDRSTGVPCGFGPPIDVDGRRVLTSVTGRVGDVLEGRPLRWQVCSDRSSLETPSGTVLVRARATAEFAPVTLELLGAGAPRRAAAQTPVSLERPTPAQVVATLPQRSAPTTLVVAQNFHSGWEAATADGRTLTPVRVNGWQQGWLVPAGSATAVSASFTPDVPYQLALLLGALLLVSGLVLTVALARRDEDARPSRLTPARPTVVLAVAAAAVAVVGGPVAVAALLVVGVVALLPSAGRHERPDPVVWWSAGRRRRRAVLALAVLGPVAAAVVVAADPWPGGRLGIEAPVVQAGVWLGVAASLWVALGDGRRRPRLGMVRTRRMTGRSSTT
ncbi:arabinofuranan 3-O-arabinosyltransferase [Humibacillus xanthopallidus]|uniref:Arabinofuranan 3-O-arabinosyltransferase n=1 Tax=Humibacillus xanthopallidus TaxID=412689 RepID=A0A543HIW2_9MICO|nr:arabinofuranan 3-O-arabinosyltransferase [Humibacillus xanthopallidus]